MTNDLTAQHLEAMNKDIAYDYIEDCVEGKEDAATSCAAITVEHMKGFERWKIDNKWQFNLSPAYYYKAGNTLRYTTDELINLYFEHLNKKQ